MKKFFLLIITLLFFESPVFAAVTVSVDHPQLTLDEILTLTISSDEQFSGKPDLTSLSNDFQIISTGQNSQLTIFNGKLSTHVQWVVTMLPKHAGNLLIPSFQIGSSKTQPLEIKVNDFPASSANNSYTMNSPPVNNTASKTNSQISKEIFMETSLTPKEAYPQQQLHYTIKLYFKRKLDEAFLMPPAVPNANITPLGEDIYYSTVKKGQFYRVLERNFVIIPQQSGHYEISAPVLTGVIEKDPTDILDFGNFMVGSTREPIKVVGPKQDIFVKNKPASFNNQWWLPAKQVTLKEKWNSYPVGVHVGDPITREITIQAVGVKGESLPKISQPLITNLNVYAEPVLSKTENDDHNLIGTLKQKFVMVPTQAGVLKIPQIKLSWWNTNSNTMQTLHLPARTITVLPVNAVQKISTSSPSSSLPKQNPLPTPDTFKNMPHESYTIQDLMRKVWPFLGFMAIAALLTFIFYRSSKKHVAKQNVMQPEKTNTTHHYSSDLYRACKNNEAAKARHALLNWGKTQWSENSMVTLLELARQLECYQNSEHLRQEILSLDRFLYANERKSWQGITLWKAFETWKNDQKKRQNKSSKHEEEDLPSLYLQ